MIEDANVVTNLKRQVFQVVSGLRTVVTDWRREMNSDAKPNVM